LDSHLHTICQKKGKEKIRSENAEQTSCRGPEAGGGTTPVQHMSIPGKPKIQMKGKRREVKKRK